jgi:general stress protein 26
MGTGQVPTLIPRWRAREDFSGAQEGLLKGSIFLLGLVAGLYSAVLTFAQADPATPPDRTAVINAATEIMLKARYCSMITLDSDGSPQVREVDPFAPEEGMVVWLATKPGTRKVAQIKRDPRVALSYLDPDGGGYVTLLGKADLVETVTEKDRLWKEEWSAFYKDKNKGGDYLLIRVTPTRLEVVSYAHGILNDPTTWAPASISFP